MKGKKLLSMVLAASAVAGLASCNDTNSSDQSNASSELGMHIGFYDANQSNDESEVFDYLIDALKMSGKSLISSAVSSLISAGMNALLKEMGYDTRSITDKKLDHISEQIDALQATVEAGIQNIMRQQIVIRNETIMNELLRKINEVSGPISSASKTLNQICQKELSGEYSEETLKQERLTFAKGIDELKFTSLTANKVWYSTKLLAEAIMTPSASHASLTLWDLYEDTYGAIESWDYMTIAPRTQFISYLAFLVNAMAEYSKAAADYEISLLPPGDSNITTITDGIEKMVESVNKLNGQFQEQLIEFEKIEKKHDEEKTITHRDRSLDSFGNIVVTDGVSLSTRLLPTTVGESNYNYLIYDHDDGARWVDTGGGQGYWQQYVYTLDCINMTPVYENIFNEYVSYNTAMGYTNFTDFTIKDYLATAGFYCKDTDKENFLKSEGFYARIGIISGERSGGWDNYYYDEIAVNYNFKTRDPGFVTYSELSVYRSWPWSDRQYTTKNDLDHWFINFLDPDQKTLCGEITTTVMPKWGEQYRGYSKWSKAKGTSATILDEHK